MTKNEEIVLEITDVTHDGSGIGKYGNMAVFVPLTAKGDTVKAKILKVKKTYAYAKMLEIITPSRDRVTPDCKVFSRCGGCVYRHINYSSQLKIKQNKVYENMKRIGGIDLPPQPVLSGECNRYRNKAQYPVSANGLVGFYATHSHRITETDCCLLQPQIFDSICAVFTQFIKKYNIPVYNESSHKGLVRHLYLRYAQKTDEIMVCLVLTKDSLPHEKEFENDLIGLLGTRLKSFIINVNNRDTNVILGEKCRTVYGSGFITDVICGIKIRISPLSFYQVNRDMAELLYKKAAEYLRPDGKNIIDLYCGTGTIGLTMAATAESIIGVEVVADAVRDAKVNAEINGIKNARFICADAADAAQSPAKEKIKCDAVVLDPPRKGCEEKLLKTVAYDFSPETIVYISCDSATLARDAAVLQTFGYSLTQYTPVDMFPQTHHIETLAKFIKSNK